MEKGLEIKDLQDFAPDLCKGKEVCPYFVLLVDLEGILLRVQCPI